MKHILCALTLLAPSFLAHAQMPAQLLAAERGKLLAGVQSVPKVGSPGPIAVWGSLAFPILSAADDSGVEQVLAAAAAYGKGKIILFGQNGYLNGSAGGDLATLLKNSVAWVGGKQKPRVGLLGVSAGFYTEAGFNTETLSALSEKSLRECDVLIMNAQGQVDAAAGKELMDWVKAGGGLISGMTGWAFEQTSGGKDLAVAHGVNQALMVAGVAFTDLSAFGGVQAFQARAELPAMLNASDAISAIRAQTQGGAAATTEAAMKQGMASIQTALAAQPPGRNTLQAAVMTALGDSGAQRKLPSESAPLTAAADMSDRLRLGMETRVLRLAGGESVQAHPAHQAFPGKVDADAPRTKAEVEVNPTIPGWTSTGMYAAAGETITVTVPAAAVGKGYAVRIGCHSDTLYHLEKWQRAPDITRKQGLDSATTETSSAFGGLIYIEVPGDGQGAAFSATVAGAVPAPLFVLGKDDDAKWNSELKKRPAPWAELACDKMIITCPTAAARTVNTPTMLMEFWKRVVEAQDDVTNQATERRRPERIVADVQISAGYMHSGYPIMIPTSAALEMVTFNKLKFPGWGFYHEIGHNHQRPTFTFEGTGEVTNNVIGMYCYEAVLGKDWLIGHPGITPQAREEHVGKIKKAGDKWATWKSDPFLALTTYIQLVQEFGWPSWRSYLHSFEDPKFGPKPKGDQEARDQFLIRYSKIVNANLAPFFEAWGIPVSSAAKAEVSKMEPWMPKGL